MKIAVTYKDGQVFQHFGHTAQFKVYDIDGGAVVSAAVLGTEGSGHGALANWLKNEGVDTLICGGIGAGAQQALAKAGIRLYGGVTGDADAAVQELLADRLAYDPDIACSHHGEHHHHEEGHQCHCGEHQ